MVFSCAVLTLSCAVGVVEGQQIAGEFCAVARIKPKVLRKTILADSSPIHAFLPPGLVVEKYDQLNVKSLTVLAGPKFIKTSSSQDPTSQIDMAMVIELDRKTDREKLLVDLAQQELSVEGFSFPKAEPVRIQGWDCLEFPAGTFLPVARKNGTLRFLDREGKPAERGVNVGNEFDYRSFVQGNSPGRAIFTFDKISEDDLINGQLELRICEQVVRTHDLALEKLGTFVQLTTSDGKCSSQPFRIPSISFVTKSLAVPRKLKVSSNGTDFRDGDLFEDLVDENQRLSISLFGNRSGIYHGWGDQSVFIKRPASEFVYMNGNRLIVAQTEKALTEVVKNENEILKEFEIGASETNAAIFVAKTPTEAEREVVLGSLQLLGIRNFFPERFRGADSIRFSLDSSTGACELTIDFERKSLAKTFQWDVVARWPKFWNTFATEFDNRIVRRQVGANLASIAFSGIRLSFIQDKAKIQSVRDSLKFFVDQWRDSLQTNLSDERVTLKWRPPEFFANLAATEKLTVTLLEEATSQYWFDREKFDKSSSLSRQLSNRMPDELGLAMRMAHQHTFNESRNFVHGRLRYIYVRRGILELLNFAEKNNEDPDAIAMAGLFIAIKMGRANEYQQILPHFLKDKELLEKLARFAKIEKDLLSDVDLVGLKVAQRILSHVIKNCESKSIGTKRIPGWILYSQPFLLATSIAQKYDYLGKFEESAAAWKRVDERLNELVKMRIPVGRGVFIQFDAASKTYLAPSLFPDEEKLTEVIEEIRDSLGLDYWKKRCRLEQTPKVRSLRKTLFALEQIPEETDANNQINLCRQSMDHLKDLEKTNADDVLVFASELKWVAERYKSCATELSLDVSPEHESILKLIDSATTRVRSPLGINWSNDFSFDRRKD